MKRDTVPISRTYSGFLEGQPNEKLNKRVIEQLKYPSEWGVRKCVEKVPSTSELQGKLKSNICCAYLVSDSINSNADGSQLVVIWLADNPNLMTLEDYIESGIQDIDWDNEAEDFDY